MAESLTNLFAYDLAGLEVWFDTIGEKPFRARQLMRWVYHKNELNFADMTDFSKALRDKLSACAELRLPAIQTEQLASDGVCKWVLEVAPEQCVEMVFIPEGRRGTLCISSQIGCALECSFCATGRQGFNGHLTADQIVGQIYLAQQRLQANQTPPPQGVTNVVFMGMGEPLLNFDAALIAANVAMDDLGFGLSRRRVTLSTAGVVPAIKRLAEVSKVSLAVSLHAPNDELRDELVPLNKKYPIAELLEACQIYDQCLGQGRVVTFEYTLIRDVNDTDEHARQLVALLRQVPCKINLIPFNSFPGVEYVAPTVASVRAFSKRLTDAGFRTTVRATRGSDIAAACGQLVGRFQDRTKRRLRHAQKDLTQSVEKQIAVVSL